MNRELCLIFFVNRELTSLIFSVIRELSFILFVNRELDAFIFPVISD